MGIPRLLQDLLPYATRHIFGVAAQETTPTTLPQIETLIIDGPALVYFAFNRLVAQQGQRILSPSYSEINDTVRSLLDDLHEHGISILHIYFDGGLPHHKRPIRLARLEKLRQQLENLRRVHPSHLNDVSPSAPLGDTGVVWEATSTSNSIRAPPPPFMVASAIEALREYGSMWKDRVTLVAGEADTFCASAAQHSSCPITVLTNDSDLAVYDLGTNGSVALLNTLETLCPSNKNGSFHFTVMVFSPSQVAAKLKIPSMSSLGFERYLDPSASLSTIKTRAIEASRLGPLHDEYNTFMKQFELSLEPPTDRITCLQALDPRLAEIVVDTSTLPQIYLTPLFEDPQRDSAWTYGANIRRLAYSLLALRAQDCVTGMSTVTEIYRRGQRIVATNVPALGHAELLDNAAHIQQHLSDYLVPSSNHAPAVDKMTTFSYYAMAVSIVYEEKIKLNKSQLTVTEVHQLFGSRWPLAPKPNHLMQSSWGNIHLLGCIQAVLCATRMLKQTLDYIFSARADVFQLDTPIWKAMIRLHDLLTDLPPIATLFQSLSKLRRTLNEINSEDRTTFTNQVQKALQLQSPLSVVLTSDTSEEGAGRSKSRSIETGLQSKKRRLAHDLQQSKPKPRTTTSGYNSFNILRNGED